MDICIGNNLLDQEQEMAASAETIVVALQDGLLDQAAVQQSVVRVQKRRRCSPDRSNMKFGLRRRASGTKLPYCDLMVTLIRG